MYSSLAMVMQGRSLGFSLGRKYLLNSTRTLANRKLSCASPPRTLVIKSILQPNFLRCSSGIQKWQCETNHRLYSSDHPLRFDDRVAIVTGAGSGLGKTYALLLASRGAKVVVNDLGGSRHGEGGSSSAADAVVEEIKNNGGIAVANYDSVEDGDKVVETALANFGRIDILVNNAGILRDKSVTRISDKDWDLVHQVHMRGAFLMTRAAWPHMKTNKYGRIVMTSSVAGIFGNFGQANYSAAKLGLVGLSNTLAIEGRKSGIHCNTIVPLAASRLTEDVLPPDLFSAVGPEHIAPVVGWLCHEDCQDTGAVVEAAGGWAGMYRWERSGGAMLLQDGAVQMEKVRDQWGKVGDMAEADTYSNGMEGIMDIVQRVQAHKAKPAKELKEGPDVDKIKKFLSEPKTFNYTTRDVILYNLGLGASTLDKDGLRYLYEGDDNFCPIPTYGVIPGFASMTGLITGEVDGLEIDLTRVLHGEQCVEVLSPLPPEAELTSTWRVADILDKGKGMVVITEVETKDEQGRLLIKNQSSTFVVGKGGFGGARDSASAIPPAKVPSRAPDAVREFTTNVDQAALYRLSGDPNPLHIDPSFAAMGGFSTPILHGLCSYGVAVRLILEVFGEEKGGPEAVAKVKVRFASPVLPGQTLKTNMWKEGNIVVFTSEVKETGKKCLDGGFVEFRE